MLINTRQAQRRRVFFAQDLWQESLETKRDQKGQDQKDQKGQSRVISYKKIKLIC
jgi:hypothetical protein